MEMPLCRFCKCSVYKGITRCKGFEQVFCKILFLNGSILFLIILIKYSQLNIIFNVPHPSLILHVPDKLSRNTILILTQEIKRDIIYRRMNLPPSANQPADPQRITAHINLTLQRLHSYLQYIGLAKYAKATQMLQSMMEINLEDLQ
jgi:hypothetical protein